MSYYSSGFWMSDKPLVQQAVAGELAELVLTITDVPSSLNFLRGFWTMTVREWNGIDRLRCASCILPPGITGTHSGFQHGQVLHARQEVREC